MQLTFTPKQIDEKLRTRRDIYEFIDWLDCVMCDQLYDTIYVLFNIWLTTLTEEKKKPLESFIREYEAGCKSNNICKDTLNDLSDRTSTKALTPAERVILIHFVTVIPTDDYPVSVRVLTYFVIESLLPPYEQPPHLKFEVSPHHSYSDGIPSSDVYDIGVFSQGGVPSIHSLAKMLVNVDTQIDAFDLIPVYINATLARYVTQYVFEVVKTTLSAPTRVMLVSDNKQCLADSIANCLTTMRALQVWRGDINNTKPIFTPAFVIGPEGTWVPA